MRLKVSFTLWPIGNTGSCSSGKVCSDFHTKIIQEVFSPCSYVGDFPSSFSCMPNILYVHIFLVKHTYILFLLLYHSFIGQTFAKSSLYIGHCPKNSVLGNQLICIEKVNQNRNHGQVFS